MSSKEPGVLLPETETVALVRRRQKLYFSLQHVRFDLLVRHSDRSARKPSSKQEHCQRLNRKVTGLTGLTYERGTGRLESRAGGQAAGGHLTVRGDEDETAETLRRNRP